MGDCDTEDQRAYVYFLTNDRCNVLYIGSTSELKKRLCHHKNRLIAGFTRKYNIHRLVYFEEHSSIEAATDRERYLKGKSRAKKNAIVEAVNPRWCDLSSQLQ